MEPNPASNARQQALTLPSTAPQHAHPPDEEPGTPSSTIAEFGDTVDAAVPPAFELAGNVRQSSHRSRLDRLLGSLIATLLREGWDRGLMARFLTELRGAADPSMSMMGIILPVEEANDEDDDAPAHQGGVVPRASEITGGRGGPSELAGERQLYQRIVAFLLSNGGIVAEMCELERELVEAGQYTQRVRDADDRKERRAYYEAVVVERNEEEEEAEGWSADLSDDDIAAWFVGQEGECGDWARTYGPRHIGRLLAGLHPDEQEELCHGVRGFLQLTDAGGLPPAILDSDGEEVGRALLQGMLANFLCAEIITSPVWVFAAAHQLVGEEEQLPFYHASPSRPPFFSPRHVPGQPDAQRDAEEPVALDPAALLVPIQHRLRAQIMRIFASSGMHLRDAPDSDDSARALFACRLSYAQKLRDAFLGGPARFLLRHQEEDPAVVEQRDRDLAAMIDEALRFSCDLWSRLNAVRLVGWGDLGGTRFEAGGPLMSLWRPPARTGSFRDNGGDGGGCRVTMVVQPAVVDVEVGSGGPGGNPTLGEHDPNPRVWLKAQVVVTPSADSCTTPPSI